MNRAVRGRPQNAILTGIAVLALLFICLPVLIVIPMSFSGASTIAFPPPTLSLRWYEAFFADARWVSAMRTSLVVALVSSAMSLVLGALAAYGLTRRIFRGLRFVELNFAVPMVIPNIITAIALYMAFARLNLLGSVIGLVVAHTILATPYVVLVVSVALSGFDHRLEQIALTLGASWHEVLLRVVAPILAPSLLAAWIFAFVVSFDEITVTVFLAGTQETIPKRMFAQLMERVDPTITAVATMLIGVSVLSVAGIAWLMNRAGLFGGLRS